MSEDGAMDQFLDQMRGEGVDSEGVFTVDFQKAREKMARVQLGHRTHYLLKLVQAGVLNAERIVITPTNRALRIELSNWNHEAVGLEKIGQSLCSLFDAAPEDAAGCLAVGLNAALEVSSSKTVTVSARLQGEALQRTLTLGESPEWSELDKTTPPRNPYLEITIQNPSHPAVEALETLQQRCRFSPIPIHFQGDELGPAELPETAGKHLGEFFEENCFLGEFRLGGIDAPGGSLKTTIVCREIQQAHPAWLGLGVDLDPYATVAFLKHGVLSDYKQVNLGCPGLVAVVEANDLATDLTALQILENDRYKERIEEVRSHGFKLLEETVNKVEHLSSQKQSTSASAPMSELSAFISKSGIAAGLILPWFLAHDIGQGVLQMFGILLATPVVALTSGFFTGYGKNEASDRAARQSVSQVWAQALRARGQRWK